MHYKSYSALTRDITEICQQRGFECSAIGKVGDKRQYPLLRVVIEPPEYAKTLLVISGVHAGTEPAPVTAVVEFLQDYEVLPVRVVIFPCLNPHGLVHGTRRNWEGKDLNRTRNGYMQTEQSLLFLHTYNQKIDCVVSLHEDPWLSGQCYGFAFNRKHQSFYSGLLKAMGQHMKLVQKETLDGLPVEHSIIWDRYDTSLESRFAEAGVPLCFCSETGKDDLQKRVRANMAVIQKAAETLM